MPVHKTETRNPVNLIVNDLGDDSEAADKISAHVAFISLLFVNSVRVVRTLPKRYAILATDICNGPPRLFCNGQIKVNESTLLFSAVHQNNHQTNYDRLNLSGRGEFR